jgi:hypothetical protein
MPTPFAKGIDMETADKYISDYRDSGLTPHVIYYEYGEIQNYITNIFPRITEAQPTPPNGYRWVVGFYGAVKDINKIFYLVAPALVKFDIAKGSPNVLECYDDSGNFNRDLKDQAQNPGFIYDEGHLWP